MIVHYNKRLKKHARELRKNSTFSEVLLWQQLKKKLMMGHDFHRQKPIDEYIVDFFCPELKLIIEINGISHMENPGKDGVRQSKLESLGFHFLCFEDAEVKQNMEGILIAIEEWIRLNQKPV